MTEHRTWVDEMTNYDGDGWQAVCEDCSWSSRSVYADEYEHLLNGKRITNDDLDEDGELIASDYDEMTTPGDQAHDQAVLLGQAHTEEHS